MFPASDRRSGRIFHFLPNLMKEKQKSKACLKRPEQFRPVLVVQPEGSLLIRDRGNSHRRSDRQRSCLPKEPRLRGMTMSMLHEAVRKESVRQSEALWR
jgi:hypothetical protein